ncbi:hypothetical protein FRC02_001571 [Tulasnella sp. 418]|nr:hypothetical protein FRC02_001571 [Tulasnella sp. 418]
MALALTAQEKRIVKDTIDRSHDKIVASAWGETYYSLPGSDLWTKQNDGGLAFVYNRERQAFSLVMVDLQNCCVSWEHEIDDSVELRRHSSVFASFNSGDLFVIGLSLSDEAEANKMFKKLSKRHEIQNVEVTFQHVIHDLSEQGIGKKTLKREKSFIRKFIKTACRDGLEQATEKFEIGGSEKVRNSSRASVRGQILKSKASFTIKRPLPPIPTQSAPATPTKMTSVEEDKSRSVRFTVMVNNNRPQSTMDAERRKSLMEQAKAKGPPPPPPVRRSTA